MVLKELIFYTVYFREGVVVFKVPVSTTLGGCGGLERTWEDF